MLDGDTSLAGGAWVESAPLGTPRLTLFLDPAANQAAVGLALVRHALRRVGRGRHIRLESSDRDPAFAGALEEMGFRARRTLIQMRWLVS